MRQTQSNLTKLVVVKQMFLIETPRTPLPWCQLTLDVVYPYIFSFFALFPGQKGKDLNLFFFDSKFTSAAHFCSFLTKRILMKGRVRYLQGYKKT